MESRVAKASGAGASIKTTPDIPSEHASARGVWLLSLGMAVIFLYLLYRNFGLYPTVMADEWAYSLYSRLVPFSRSPIPSYLFLWLFRQTNHGGNSYLECARLFNCLLFVGSAPFIYVVSRRVTQPLAAAWIALLALVGPVSTYTAYFMPEAMYFFGFWLLTWLVLVRRRNHTLFYGGVIGITLAGLLMVKVHAIFLLPGVGTALIASIVRFGGRNRLAKSALMLTSVAVTAVVVRLLLGCLFAGTSGLHILGQKYGAVADSSLTVRSLIELVGPVLFVIKGHLLGLALLYAVPLASLVAWQRNEDSPAQDEEFFVIKIYALSTLIFLLIVTAYYTASVVGQPHEALDRMHLRYYNFALPLLFIVAAGEWTTMRRSKLLLTLPIGIVIGSLAIYSLRALRTQYAPNAIDSPELQAAFFSNRALHVIFSVGLVALAIWVFSRRRGAQFFLFVALPVTVLTTAQIANTGLRFRLHPDSYEQAGQTIHAMLSREERSKLAVVGSDEVELYRSLFQVDSADATMVIIPEGAAPQMTALRRQDDWVLVVGSHSIPSEFQLQFPRSGFSLFKRKGSAP
jgi:phosphoglycerol transferase